VLAHRLRDAMAEQEVPLYARAPEVEVAEAEAVLLGHVLRVVDRVRRRARRVEDAELRDRDLDPARRQLGVDGVGRPRAHGAGDGDDELEPHLARALVRLRVLRRIEDELENPRAVAQVDEADAAVVPPGVHPAADDHRAPDVLLAQRAGVVGPLPVAHRLDDEAHAGASR
jgi:hypothetical protein